MKAIALLARIWVTGFVWGGVVASGFWWWLG